MMRRISLLISGCGLLALCGVGAVLIGEAPVGRIASELSQAARDPRNDSVVATLIRDELDSAARRRSAVFAMPCFWSGEGYFGLQPGVYRTTPGFLNGHEVVEVEYDPQRIDYATLTRQARQAGMAGRVYCRTDADLSVARTIAGDEATLDPKPIRIDETPKWYLQQTALKHLPLTPAQSTRLNAFLHARQPIDPLLSPTQRELAKQLLADRDSNWSNRVGDETLYNEVKATPAR